jgi:hypothetical protein
MNLPIFEFYAMAIQNRKIEFGFVLLLQFPLPIMILLFGEDHLELVTIFLTQLIEHRHPVGGDDIGY